ncbi:pyrroloquinoline quinone biosynthesis protein PqqB [Plastorhodobacter daqingensis]|uniref:Coenzyme PQQ synthesis protein B n=1 Tax=Plastorhodobacter daqingensis TaxID=1387281 RepID=A0ABW2UJE1_9RHOB
MLHIIVLGSAAGGGLPQWNCNCTNCRAARADPALRNGQTGLAASVDGEHWFLINAAPDLRQQLIDTPALHPRQGRLRDAPLAGVILTNGEVDAVAGLLSLREGTPFALHAHADVLATLEANSIFNVLDRALVPRVPILPDQPFEPRLPDGRPSGLQVLAFAVPGKPAWYLEGTARPGEGDTMGLFLQPARGGKGAFVIPGCGAITPPLADRLAGADLVLMDGTLWSDDEMIRAGLSQKTGARMGHVSMSGPEGAIAALSGLGIARKVFIHINNSNPALMPDTPERHAADAAGWTIATPGTEFRHDA